MHVFSPNAALLNTAGRNGRYKSLYESYSTAQPFGTACTNLMVKTWRIINFGAPGRCYGVGDRGTGGNDRDSSQTLRHYNNAPHLSRPTSSYHSLNAKHGWYA